MLISNRGARDWRLFFANDFVLTFNGEALESFFEADDEAGYIVRPCMDEHGKPIREGLFLKLKTERVEGAVVFSGTKRWSPDDAKLAAMDKRDRRALRNLRIQTRADARACGAT